MYMLCLCITSTQFDNRIPLLYMFVQSLPQLLIHFLMHAQTWLCTDMVIFRLSPQLAT